jgi:hypothetical protein
VKSVKNNIEKRKKGGFYACEKHRICIVYPFCRFCGRSGVAVLPYQLSFASGKG